jgi:hypothetical protein
MNAESDDDAVHPTIAGPRTAAEAGRNLLRPSGSHPASAQVTVHTPQRPVRSSGANVPSPAQSSTDVDYASDSTLLSPMPHRGNTQLRAPGYAVALRRLKAGQHLSPRASKENGLHKRPAKRPRVSEPSANDPDANVNMPVDLPVPSVDPFKDINVRHLGILYLSYRNQKYCRSCLCVSLKAVV